MTAAMILLAAVALILLAAAYVLYRRAAELERGCARLEFAFKHAQEERRAAEERAGGARAELLALQDELAERGYRASLRQIVVVQTKDRTSIKGVLTAEYEDLIVLAHPEWIQGPRPEGIPGEARIPRANIAWLQVPPSTEAAEA